MLAAIRLDGIARVVPTAPPAAARPVDGPGVYALSHAAYHADPCPEPSLSSTRLREMVTCSPLHAMLRHPRLGPGLDDPGSAAMDIGSAAHALLLGDERQLDIADFPDWRTNQAKLRRAAARAAGRVPLLSHAFATVQAMAAAARAQLDRQGFHALFRPGHGDAELALVWREGGPPAPSGAGRSVNGHAASGGVWCRCRPDWLPRQRGPALVLWDYKTTAVRTSALWMRLVLQRLRGDLQAGFYARGARAVLGACEIRFRFVVQSVRPPFPLRVIDLPVPALARAEAEAGQGTALWARCLATGHWPAHPFRIVGPDLTMAGRAASAGHGR